MIMLNQFIGGKGGETDDDRRAESRRSTTIRVKFVERVRSEAPPPLGPTNTPELRA